ncbi:MAG: hypothetical protein JST40_08450 [Armatimonadetes bacterium]|nr:hypothetical protein [Armatimonadota bacterium]
MRRFGAIIACLVVAASAFAWHEDQIPGAGTIAEDSNAKLESQQSMNGAIPEVGTTPMQLEEKSIATTEGSEKSAEDNISKVDTPSNAANNLKVADTNLKHPMRTGPAYWLWFLVFAVFGGGYVYARRWANTNIKMMEVKPTIRR